MEGVRKMRKMTRILSFIMVCAVLFSSVDITAFAAQAEQTVVLDDGDGKIVGEEIQNQGELNQNEKQTEESQQNNPQTEEDGSDAEGEESQDDLTQEGAAEEQIGEEEAKNPEEEAEENTEEESEKEKSEEESEENPGETEEEEVKTPEEENKEETTEEENTEDNIAEETDEDETDADETIVEEDWGVSGNEIQKTAESKAEVSEDEYVINNYDDILPMKVVEVDVEDIKGEIYDVEELYQLAENSPSFLSESYGEYWDNYSSHYIYNQLNETERKLWRALEVLGTYYLENDVNLAEDHIDYVMVRQADFTADRLSEIANMFRYSHPQYYYLMSGWWCMTSGSNYGLAFMVYDKFQDGAARRTATNAIKEKLEYWESIINSCSTEEEKVKTIHDLVCNMVDYNHGVLDVNSDEGKGISDAEEQTYFTQSAYSAFCTDLTVCAGYTQAFTWLCNGADIESFGVTGPGHAWNKVNVNDNWYTLDCTWDDGNGEGNFHYGRYLNNDAYFDGIGSHFEDTEWEAYLPVCTLARNTTSTAIAGTLPVIEQKAATPEITVVKGENSYSVTMNCSTTGAKIYYTLDGKTPSESNSKGYLYKGTFEINETAQIRAIAVCDQMWDSGIAEEDIEFIDYDIASGTCGTNITWRLNSANCLILSGSGSMTDYTDAASVPWSSYVTQIEDIEMADAITSIGDYAFYGLTNIQGFEFPENIADIGTYAFAQSGVTEIEIPDSVNSVGDYAFYNSPNLNTVVIEGDIASLGYYTFYYCLNLKNVTLPKGFSKISSCMFATCKSLKEIVLPEGITFVGSSAFMYCSLLSDVTLPESLKNISQNAFASIGLEQIYIPRGVTTIATGAFDQNVIIRGYAGSAAETYAAANGNTFIDISTQGIKVQFVTGTEESVPAQYCEENERVTEPVLTKGKKGYTLAGWYTSAEIQDDTTKWDFENDTVTEAITLYAKWTPKTYKLNFDLNYEGAGNLEPKDVTYDAAYGTLPQPMRSGYDFVGWYTEAEKGEEVTENTLYTIDGNTTLYARWKAKSYKLNFNLNYEGAEALAPQEVTYDAAYGTLPQPTRSGYDFTGWYTEALNGKKVTEETLHTTDGDTTLYARWKAKTYKVNFDLNYAEAGTLEPIEVTFDTAYGTLPQPIRSGYDFVGWYTEAENGEEVTKDTKHQVDGNITLYAKWSEKTYRLSFDLNYAGAEALAPQDVTYGAVYGILPQPTRSGYDFAGWYTEAENGEEVTKDTLYTTIGDTTLYARWSPKVYVITFNANADEGTVQFSKKEVKYYETYGELPNASLEGAKFLGWYTQAEGGEQITEQTRVEILENQTLYAHWEYKSAEMPVASEPAGELEPGTRVLLSTATKGAKIYYTTDDSIGTNVNKDSTLYDDAIIINENMTIYAVAYEESYKYRPYSPVMVVSYTVRDTSEDWGDVLEVDRSEFGSPSEIPKDLWVAGVEDCDYLGKAVTYPEMRVYHHKTLLTEKTDYIVKYKNNTKAGKATITITGKGNYTGVIEKNFTIHPLDLGAEGLAEAADIILGYNKKVQKGTTTVKYLVGDKWVTLKKDTDYTLEYPKTNSKAEDYDANAFKEPDTYEVTVRGKGNYTGTTTFTQEIVEENVIGKMTLTAIPKQKYTGSEIKPKITLKHGKTPLYEGTNYDVDYENNVGVGTATVTITGIEDSGYVGTRTATFQITGTALSKVKMTGFASSLPWEETPVEQENVTFSYTTGKGEEKETHYLEEGKHYEVEYINHDKVGTATVIYTGNEEYGYTGSVKKTYKITGVNMKNVEINIPQTTLPYDGKDMVLENYELSYNGELLKESKEEGDGGDYTVSYKNHHKAGDATVTFKGINGYTGSISKKYKITAYDLKEKDSQGNLVRDKIQISAIPDMKYTKGGVTPKLTVTYKGVPLEEGKDYTLTYANHKAVAAKTAAKPPTVTITGKNGFKNSVRVTFSIIGSDLAETTITAKDVVWQNKANICKPSITVTDSNGKKLEVNRDYKVISYTYAETTEVTRIEKKKEVKELRYRGVAVDKKDIIPIGTEIIATVKGIKNYEAEQTKEVRFRFVAGDISKATITVKAQAYEGKAVEPNKNDITVKIGKIVLAKTDYEIIEYSNNTKAGTGKLVIEGRGNYSGQKTATFKISAKNMNYTIVYDKNEGEDGVVVTGTMKNSNISVGKKLTANAYKKNGYIFTGWNTEPDGSGASYTNKEAFYLKDNKMVYGKQITLYAQWEKK